MWRLLCTILLGVFAVAHAGDQQTITVNVDLVNVYFTVANSRGRLVPGLAPKHFAVLEDGAPQTITHFSRETDIPITIVMLIDTSGSVRDKVRFERQAAANFLYAALRRGQDHAALVTFNHTFDVLHDFTDDSALLATALAGIRAGGGTRVYDALHFVLEEKLRGPEERKVIVLITDGTDKSSRRSPQAVAHLAQLHNASIYAISLNALGARGDEADESDRILETLAKETGGKAFFPDKPEKLTAHFKHIADELRSQYTVGYRSTNAKRDGSFRNIHIEVKKPRYSVRARAGYYAPAEVMAQ